MMALCSFSFVACSDDDYIPGKSELDADRELMTMFRVDDNSNKGDTDPYRCQVVNINDVQLRWYGVDGCAGYELKWGLQGNVSSGLAEDWENPKNIEGSVILGPDELEYLVKDLQYSTPYHFAIRTLSKKVRGTTLSGMAMVAVVSGLSIVVLLPNLVMTLRRLLWLTM